MKKLVTAAGFVTLVASSAFAQPNADKAAAGAARAAAIHGCSAVAARYTEYTWGNMEIDQYRACMSVRGQTE